MGGQVGATRGRTRRRRRRHDQRGVVFGSPVVMLSVIAVAMAGIAFLATRDNPSDQRQLSNVSDPVGVATETPSAASSPAPSSAGATAGSPGSAGTPTPTKPAEPALDRSKIYVVVFNNSNISGLASQTATKVSQIGWQVVGSDNWYGTIPATTVYYPARMQKAGQALALDLGIQRILPSVDPMRSDRLTVILTAPLG